MRLTSEQHEECLYNFYNNDVFDQVLLDERDLDGTITTVVKYDEETILIQKIVDGEFDYEKISNEDFIKAGRVL